MINPPELISVMKGSFNEFHMRLLRNAPGALIRAFAISRFRSLVTVPRTYLNSFINETKCLSFRSPDLAKARSVGTAWGSSHPILHISSSADTASPPPSDPFLNNFRDFSTGDTPGANSRRHPSLFRPFSIQTRSVNPSKTSAIRASSSRNSVGDLKSIKVVTPNPSRSIFWSALVAPPNRPDRKIRPGKMGDEAVAAKSRQFLIFSAGRFRSSHNTRISSLYNFVSSSSTFTFITGTSVFVIVFSPLFLSSRLLYNRTQF
mmetsp:Transcript_45819/g.51947  ORF Transcript_45819/g.51947 Transcript_45819/m.51947 type:complete len:261 (+) Transcript_45819:2896-3678(+)